MAPNEKRPAVEAAPEVSPSIIAQAQAAAAGNAEAAPPYEHSSPTPAVTVEDHDEHDEPPPPYGEELGQIDNGDVGLGIDTKARVAEDGRVDINIDQTSQQLSTLLIPALRQQLDIQRQEPTPPPPYIPPFLGGQAGESPPPPLNVVMHVVGSRGDVQPFVALGLVLKETYGHRVRLATHPVFKDFVTENGLEFFSIGGDPAELMAFMVKNPGLMPGFDTLRKGDIGKRRKEMTTMIYGCWRSCFESGDGTGPPATEETTENWMGNDSAARALDPTEQPFVADAIIANPPSFAHIHCAEKLGCPLHIMFTMPHSPPTQAFPHPLANIKTTNADPQLTNYLSYVLVKMMTWQGLGDIINRFRQNTLGLDPWGLTHAPVADVQLKIPHTYCWSPALIPKPKDWASYVTICGFWFLNLASNYTPAPDLQEFLDAGPPPLYIGFGSIVVDDPNAMTTMIFEAVRKTGQRALVSKGWGGLGADDLGMPEGVFMLGNVPHDWLFKHVSAVVHHGGAGTTSAGIAAGRPTVIVPFFGDQPFWGAMVAKAGAGPQPLSYKELDADKLAAQIEFALKPETQARAHELAESISHENGTQQGAQDFHQFLEVDKMRCTLAPSRAAVWRLKRTNVRFSALAAVVLANEGLLDFKDLKLWRAREYAEDEGPLEPLSGVSSALAGTVGTMMMGVADLPTTTLKALGIHPDAARAKKEKKKESSSGDQAPNDTSSSHQETPTASTDPSNTLDPQSSNMSVRSPSPSSQPNSPGSSQFNLSESLAKLDSHREDASSGRPTTPRLESMGSALRTQISGRLSRRASEQKQSSPTPPTTREGKAKAEEEPANPVETAIGTSRGLGRILKAGVESPMDFTNALAKGFHNAPKLYGDDTVRKSARVTDFQSGVAAASKEFGYGLYDGITGLVTQPIRGAKKDGAAGFVKGIGKGIGGVVLKTQAGAFAVPAYTMKGVWKELALKQGKSIQNYIIAARTAQGYSELHESHPAQRVDIVERWAHLQTSLKKKKDPDEAMRDWAVGMKSKQQTWQGEQRKKITQHLQERKWTRSKSNDKQLQEVGLEAGQPDVERSSSTQATQPAPSAAATAPTSSAQSSTGDGELEETIRRSVAESSRGNAEEDALIEQAIRASVNELQSRRPPVDEHDEDAEIESALAASLAEAEQSCRQRAAGRETHDADLERAMQQSKLHHEEHMAARSYAPRSGFDVNAQDAGDESIIRETQKRAKEGASGVVEEQEDLGHPEAERQERYDREVDDLLPAYDKQSEQETGVVNSKQQPHGPETGGEQSHDEELERVMQESRQAHDNERRERSEEDIVMEYVKKQSLIEQQHREAMVGKGKASVTHISAAGQDDEEDEELQRAMQMSMQREGQKGQGSRFA